MKKLTLIIIGLCLTMLMQAQVYKTANVTAGGLSTLLTPTELITVTNLTLTGTIDARDFKTMRNSMPVLSVLDISGVTVSAYSGMDGTGINPIYTIYPANAIPAYAHAYTSWELPIPILRSVILPPTVNYIGERAFESNKVLDSITIPPSVTSIGESAFSHCTALTSINIPSSVKTIGKEAFTFCSALTSVIIPSSVTSIEWGAFRSCSLTSVIIPSSVISIEDDIFSLCTALTSVIIPSSVTSIGKEAFRRCSALTSVIIPSSVKTIDNSAFEECSALTSVIIPSSVTSIGWGAFYACTKLTSINIPSSVISIGNGVLDFCSGLRSIYAEGVTPLDLSSSAYEFRDVNKTTCKLYVPYGSIPLYAAANHWKDFLNIEEFINPGLIAGNQAVCTGSTPKPFTSVIAGTGVGTISYRWEYSHNGTSWLPTGTSEETYSPGPLTQTTLFRRITISNFIGTDQKSVASDPVTVTVNSGITCDLSSATGTDSQTKCADKAITNITYIATGASVASFTGLPGGITGVLASDVVTISGTPSVAGTYNYSVSLTGPCGSITKTGSIVVNALPAAPTITAGGPLTICPGGNVTLTSSPGTSYLWSTGAINSNIDISAAGSYTVQVTKANGCLSAPSAATVVTVNPVLIAVVSIAASDNQVLAGTSVTFIATSINGGTAPVYQWYKGTIPVGTNSPSYSYVPADGDEIKVVMTSGASLCIVESPATSNTVKMIVNQVAIAASSNPVCDGNPVTFTATHIGGGAPSYQWYRNGLQVGSDLATYTCTPANGDEVYVVMTLNPNEPGSPVTSNTITITTLQQAVQPANFTTFTSIVCVAQFGVLYTVPFEPGVRYSWSYSRKGAATISGNSNSVTVNFSETATSGTLAVTVSNSCGRSIARKLYITVKSIPASQPGNFTASTTRVCAGQSNVTYTVPPVTGVSYNWSYSGTGATITGTTNSVLVSYSTTATSGVLSVTATDNCGMSIPRDLPVTVNTPAAQPGNFTTFTNEVIAGQSNVIYTVPFVAGVRYSWSYSRTGTATIIGTSNSVSVNFSTLATSGTLAVTVSNSCGRSIARTLYITVTPALKSGNLSNGVGINAADVSAPLAKNELKVYPNPSSGLAHFDFQINENAKVTIDLSSMTGQQIAKIFDADVEAGITQTVIFDQSLAPGVYLYAMRWNNQVITGKLIIAN